LIETILKVKKGKRYRFRTAIKIKRNREISQVFNKGKKHRYSNITAYVLHNEKNHTRCAIIVPSKIGPSADRNMLKRYVREGFRSLSETPPGFDILIKIHSGIEKTTRKAIEECLLQLCLKLKRE
jgi:ribonuclease P protein component